MRKMYPQLRDVAPHDACRGILSDHIIVDKASGTTNGVDAMVERKQLADNTPMFKSVRERCRRPCKELES